MTAKESEFFEKEPKVTITYDGRSIVTATQVVKPGEDFDSAIEACDAAIRKFKRSKPGSDWGCDGVGYYCQQKQGCAVRHRSGVGPRNFKKGK